MLQSPFRGKLASILTLFLESVYISNNYLLSASCYAYLADKHLYINCTYSKDKMAEDILFIGYVFEGTVISNEINNQNKHYFG